jgi:hypothetical protein
LQVTLNPITISGTAFSTVLRLAHSPGILFTACLPGRVPTAVLPCDTGAYALDAQDGNLTSFVTSSPATISLSTVPGSRLKIVYSVQDFGLPRLPGIAERIVEIVSPCPAGEFFCSGSCKTVPCVQAAALDELAAKTDREMAVPDLQLPLLVLVEPETPTINFVYGKPSIGVALQPCTPQLLSPENASPSNATQGTNAAATAAMRVSLAVCGAVATAADGTPLDTVAAAIAVAYWDSDDVCPLCSVMGLEQGTCLPGVYVLEYTARSLAGVAAAPVFRLVRVAEAAQLSVSVGMPYTGTLSQAQTFVQAIQSGTAAAAHIVDSAVARVSSVLRPAGAGTLQGLSEVLGSLESVTAHTTLDANVQEVSITVTVAFQYVPGVQNFARAWPRGTNNVTVAEVPTAQSLPGGGANTASASRRLAGVQSIGDFEAGVGHWQAKPGLQGEQARSLKQQGQLAGMPALLAGAFLVPYSCWLVSFKPSLHVDWFLLGTARSHGPGGSGSFIDLQPHIERGINPFVR